MPGRKIVNPEEFMRYETSDGRTLILYNDVDRLEKHLLEFSPQDAKPIQQFIQGIRLCMEFDQSSPSNSLFTLLGKKIKLGWLFVTKGKAFQEWMKISTYEFTKVLKIRFYEMPSKKCGYLNSRYFSSFLPLVFFTRKMPVILLAVRCLWRRQWLSVILTWVEKSTTKAG